MDCQRGKMLVELARKKLVIPVAHKNEEVQVVLEKKDSVNDDDLLLQAADELVQNLCFGPNNALEDDHAMKYPADAEFDPTLQEDNNSDSDSETSDKTHQTSDVLFPKTTEERAQNFLGTRMADVPQPDLPDTMEAALPNNDSVEEDDYAMEDPADSEFDPTLEQDNSNWETSDCEPVENDVHLITVSPRNLIVEIVPVDDESIINNNGPRRAHHETASPVPFAMVQAHVSTSNVEDDSASNYGLDPAHSEVNNKNTPDDTTRSNDGGQMTARKPRGRKRLHESHTKKETKRLKASNQDYYNRKGELIKKKEFNDYHCECNNKCYTLISYDDRKKIFEEFWALGEYTAQNLFITSTVLEAPVARSYVNRPQKKTEFSRDYMLSSTVVCRSMFVETLQISSKRVNTALQKFRSGNLNDNRGVQGGKNKVDISEVVDHINKLPRYKSHYKRAESNAEYLAPEMTLSKMWWMYVEEKIGTDPDVLKEFKEGDLDKKLAISKDVKAVSLSTYRRVFLSEFNLKFKSLKTDTCNTCDSLAAQLLSATGEAKSKLEKEQTAHHDLWQEARRLMNEDIKTAQQDEQLEVLTFDLEKTLPLPRLPTGIVFYKRQLWLYNAGIHSFKKKTRLLLCLDREPSWARRSRNWFLFEEAHSHSTWTWG